MNAYDQKWFSELRNEIPLQYQVSEARVRNLPQVNNLVYVVNIDREIMIKLLHQIFHNIGRNHVKFPQNKIVVVPNCNTSRSPVDTLLFYDTGKILVSGVHNLPSAIWVVQMLRYDLARYGIEVGLKRIVLANVVVHARMHGCVDLTKFEQEYKVVRWERNEFPGAMFVMRDDASAIEAQVKRRAGCPRASGVRILAFENGNVVETGGKNEEMMIPITDGVRTLLQPFMRKDTGNTKSVSSKQKRGRQRLSSSVRKNFIRAEHAAVEKLHLKPSKSALRAPSTTRKAAEEYAKRKAMRFKKPAAGLFRLKQDGSGRKIGAEKKKRPHSSSSSSSGSELQRKRVKFDV